MVKRPVGSSLVGKRSITMAGHKTSISLEDDFWNAVREIAAKREVTLSGLLMKIENERQHRNLSSAIRLFVLDHYRGIAEHKRKEE
jgi:predicted DNA-binding ribbon-helix-helix protein